MPLWKLIFVVVLGILLELACIMLSLINSESPCEQFKFPFPLSSYKFSLESCEVTLELAWKLLKSDGVRFLIFYGVFITLDTQIWSDLFHYISSNFFGRMEKLHDNGQPRAETGYDTVDGTDFTLRCHVEISRSCRKNGEEISLNPEQIFQFLIKSINFSGAGKRNGAIADNNEDVRRKWRFVLQSLPSSIEKRKQHGPNNQRERPGLNGDCN